MIDIHHILELENYAPSSVFQEEQSEDGQKRENFEMKGPLQEGEFLMLPILQNLKITTKKPKKMKSSSTAECQVIDKKTTLSAKKRSSKRSSKKIQDVDPLTFTISHPDSISKEEALSRFWKQSNKEKYGQLSWLPKIDWQGLGSTSSNGYVVSTEQKSLLSITKIQHLPKSSEKTCCQSFKFIVANGTEVDDTKKLKKTLKLRLYPTKEQKILLNKWAGGFRYTYNATLASLKNPRDKCRSWMNLRNRFVTAKGNNYFNNKPWLLSIPKSIRQGAVKEAHTNFKTCFKNLTLGNISKFFMTFKSKKKEKENGYCYGIEKNNVMKKGNQLFIFPKMLGAIKYGSTKQLHKLIPKLKPDADPRIQKDRFGDYFLLLTIDKKPKQVPKVHTKVKSGDPGVNIFLTTYNPQGEAEFIGKGFNETLLSLLESLDILISQRDTLKNDPRRKRECKALERRCIRLRKEIYYQKKELHNQVNNHVATSASLILYPKLDSQKLTLKERRTLRTKVVRQLLNLGHCTAFEKLKYKCMEHGTELLQVSEAYTTKTCPCCGELNACTHERIYRCGCGFKAERDLNGAENILLRSIG